MRVLRVAAIGLLLVGAPVLADGPSPVTEPVVPLAPPTPVVPPAAAPAPAPVPSGGAPATTPRMRWAVMAGSTLKGTLLGWSSSAGWTLVWEHPGDFDLKGSVTFEGDFESAVLRLIDGVYANYPDLHATLYRGNRTLHVFQTR